MIGALTVFWISAAGGLWSAYNKSEALIKFGMISASIILFFVIIKAHVVPPRTVAAVVTAMGLAAAVVFLLVHDWRATPADFSILERIGILWMNARPVRLPLLTAPNRTGGIIAALLPFWAAWTWMVLVSPKARRLRCLQAAGLAAPGIVMAAALLLTSSRAAWGSLAASGMLAAFWMLIVPRIDQKWVRLCLWTVAALAAGALALVIGRFSSIIEWIDEALPGLPSGGSRVQLISDSIYLAADFPLIGGGLEAYPGMYSHYMRVVPHFTYEYSHNLYLDAAVSQGWPGLIALLAALFLSLILFLRLTSTLVNTQNALALYTAGLVGIGVVLIHGLVDDAFYGGTGSVLLFLFPAVAIYGWKRETTASDGVCTSSASARIGIKYLQPAVLALFVVLPMLFYRQIASALLENLAAVEMAKIQLAGFPTGKWDDSSTAARLKPVEDLLLRANSLDPRNVGANYRLGLIALIQRDYPAAVMRLEDAHMEAPGHFGVRKNLGYAYVWSDREDLALECLKPVPEAVQELGAYAGWWRIQGRPDLAQKAGSIVEHMRR